MEELQAWYDPTNPTVVSCDHRTPCIRKTYNARCVVDVVLDSFPDRFKGLGFQKEHRADHLSRPLAGYRLGC